MNKELKIVNISIKSWKRGDKYECPDCKKKIDINKDNKYVCEECNVQVKPRMNFR